MVQTTLNDRADTTSPRSILMAPDESQEVTLARMDGRLASLEQSMKRLETSVERASTVDVKLYNSEQRAQDTQIAAVAALIAAVEKRMSDRLDVTDKRVVDAESSNRATTLYLIGIVLVALAGGLVRLALG